MQAHSIELYKAFQSLFSSIVKYLYNAPFFTGENLNHFLTACVNGVFSQNQLFAIYSIDLWRKIAKFEYSKIYEQEYSECFSDLLEDRSSIFHSFVRQNIDKIPHSNFHNLCSKVWEKIGPRLIECIQTNFFPNFRTKIHR